MLLSSLFSSDLSSWYLFTWHPNRHECYTCRYKDRWIIQEPLKVVGNWIPLCRRWQNWQLGLLPDLQLDFCLLMTEPLSHSIIIPASQQRKMWQMFSAGVFVLLFFSPCLPSHTCLSHTCLSLLSLPRLLFPRWCGNGSACFWRGQQHLTL